MNDRRHISEEEYRSDQGVNKSTLWEMRKSPQHYKYSLTHPTEDTPALKLGRAVHMAILQPEEFQKHYILAPNIDRRTNAGKALWSDFLLQAEGKEVLTADDYETVMAMYDAVYGNPEKGIIGNQAAQNLLDGAETEVSLFWTDNITGIDCKCRLDAIKCVGDKTIVIDLKTATDAKTDSFMRDAIKLGYDVQEAHYVRGVRENGADDGKIEWYWLVIEKKPPYAINIIKSTDPFRDRGTWQLIDLMEKLKNCIDTDEWPGYGMNELVLPEWALIPDGDDD